MIYILLPFSFFNSLYILIPSKSFKITVDEFVDVT